MFTIGVDVKLFTTVEDREHFTIDRVTDLIELLVDHLDDLKLEPSVSTDGVGERVNLHVEVEVSGVDPMMALVRGVDAVGGALRAAGIKNLPVGSQPIARVLIPA